MNIVKGCPTCSHTVAKLCDADGLTYLHCERCGTLCAVVADGTIRDAYVPRLVERCRAFRAGANLTERQRERWHAFGLDESINRPEDRP